MNSPTRFWRELAQVKGNVFIISPFGEQVLVEGQPPHDFDYLCRDVIGKAIEDAGMTPVRADWIYGTADVMQGVWRCIQEAELVVVVWTGRAANVALEYALAAVIGKRMVFLTQDAADIPTDVHGLRYISYADDHKSMTKMQDLLVENLVAARDEPGLELQFAPFGRGRTEPSPGTVFSVDREMAIIKTDDGRRGILASSDCDWGRLIPDMTTRYKPGDRVDGAFDTEAMKYTLLAGQPNPWPTIEADFEVGTTFTGVVVNKSAGVGAFVKLHGTVKGLLSEKSFPEVAALERGDEIEVRVERVDVANRKVQLRLPRNSVPARNVAAQHMSVDLPLDAALPTPGARIEDAEVVKVAPEGQGGYILVSLHDGQHRAMLHCTNMSEELRSDLNSARVDKGELLTVVVDKVDPTRGKIFVHDVPDFVEDEPSLDLKTSTEVTLAA